MKDYGKALKILRKRSGITQAQLAEKLNVTFQTVSKWENGVNTPDIASIELICETFSVPVEEYLRLAAGDAAEQTEDISPAPSDNEAEQPQSTSTELRHSDIQSTPQSAAGGVAVNKKKRPVDLPYIIVAAVLAGVISISAIIIGVVAGISLSPNTIHNKVKPSVFHIWVEYADHEAYASGFFIDDKGTAVTNYNAITRHNFDMLENMLSATIKLDGETYRVDNIIGVDKNRDVVVIHVDIPWSQAAPLGDSSKVKKGDKVYAIGYYSTHEDNITTYGSSFIKGKVSLISHEVNVGDYIMSSVDITPTHSGGVLINRMGQVIGMTTSSTRLVDGNYDKKSVAINIVKSFLKDMNIPVKTTAREAQA